MYVYFAQGLGDLCSKNTPEKIALFLLRVCNENVDTYFFGLLSVSLYLYLF